MMNLHHVWPNSMTFLQGFWAVDWFTSAIISRFIFILLWEIGSNDVERLCAHLSSLQETFGCSSSDSTRETQWIKRSSLSWLLEYFFCLRGGRISVDGIERNCVVEWVSVYQCVIGAQLRFACSGRGGGSGAQQHSIWHRSFHHRGRSRFCYFQGNFLFHSILLNS